MNKISFKYFLLNNIIRTFFFKTKLMLIYYKHFFEMGQFELDQEMNKF